MYNSLITKGGGYRPVPQDVVVARLSAFWRKQNKTLITLSIPQRRLSFFTLFQHFGFTTSQMAPIFMVNIRTIQRDISQYQWEVKRKKSLQQQVENLRSYLLYNAKYIH